MFNEQKAARNRIEELKDVSIIRVMYSLAGQGRPVQ